MHCRIAGSFSMLLGAMHAVALDSYLAEQMPLWTAAIAGSVSVAQILPTIAPTWFWPIGWARPAPASREKRLIGGRRLDTHRIRERRW
jgi:hypothetical protein